MELEVREEMRVWSLAVAPLSSLPTFPHSSERRGLCAITASAFFSMIAASFVLSMADSVSSEAPVLRTVLQARCSQRLSSPKAFNISSTQFVLVSTPKIATTFYMMATPFWILQRFTSFRSWPVSRHTRSSSRSKMTQIKFLNVVVS